VPLPELTLQNLRRFLDENPPAPALCCSQTLPAALATFEPQSTIAVAWQAPLDQRGSVRDPQAPDGGTRLRHAYATHLLSWRIYGDPGCFWRDTAAGKLRPG